MSPETPRSILSRFVLLTAVICSCPGSASATTAADLCAPGDNPCRITTSRPVSNGSVIDVGDRELLIDNGGELDVGGGGATMTLKAGRITVLNGGELSARGTASEQGGNINCRAGAITIAGRIRTDGAPPGNVELISSGDLTVRGEIDSDVRGADALGAIVDLEGETIDVAGAISAGGSLGGSGGSLTLSAQGNLVLSGELDTRGGDGGDITLLAGDGIRGGNFTLRPTGRIRVDAKTAGGLGGSVDITVGGDGVDNGHLTFEGALSGIGPGGSEDTGGGSGAFVDIEAAGDFRGSNPEAQIDLSGGGPDGDGGELDLSLTFGEFDALVSIDVSAVASESSGGSVFVDAAGPITVSSSIDARAGGFDGDDVSLDSGTGAVTIQDGGGIDVSAGSGGFGGGITLSTGDSTDGSPVDLVVAGRLRANGGAAFEQAAGDGGPIELNGTNDVRITAPIEARGGSGGGGGGNLTVTNQHGDIAVDADINIKGNGSTGVGGLVQIATFDGDVTVTSTVVTDAGSDNVRGGKIEIEACNTTVSDTAVLSSLGAPGQGNNWAVNRTITREDTLVFGTMRAGRRNEMFYRPGFEPPRLGTEIPPALRILDPSIPACGTPLAIPTPTATRTGTEGPSPTPTPPAGGGCDGDCNGDDKVTINELIIGVNIALGRQRVDSCAALDGNDDGEATINELIRAVNAALNGCS